MPARFPTAHEGEVRLEPDAGIGPRCGRTLAKILFVARGLAVAGKSINAVLDALSVRYLEELEVDLEKFWKEE